MRAWFVVAALGSAATAHADDEPKATVTFGGYLEAYYQLNTRIPSNQITNLRGFDNRDRTFTLTTAALEGKGEKGPVTAHLILQIGAMPSSYYLAEPVRAGTPSVNATGPELWKYLQTATLAYKGPSELTIEAGIFPSPIGPEVFAIKDNWNWSRSDLFFGLPFYHTGVRGSYPLGGGWVGTFAAYNGWNSVVDNNGSPSVAASALYTSKCTTAQVLYFGGIQRDGAWRNLFDAYVTYTRGDVAVTAHGDAGFEPNDFGTSSWVAGALYAKVDLAPKLYVAARGDYFREHVPDGAEPIFWPVPWIASGTATLAYQPGANLSVRLEYRHDQAGGEAFFGGRVLDDIPNRRAQDTITLGATAWF